MNPIRIFVNSVQREFAEERAVLRDYVRDDALIRRFFDAYLFEDVPASDRRPDHLYLDEVEQCDIYVGLFGYEYGSEDEDGLSPTAREFEHATKYGAHRLVFVKGSNGNRHPKNAVVDSQGASRPDSQAIQLDHGTRGRSVRRVGGIPGTQATDSLGAV